MIAFAENIGDQGCGLVSQDIAQDVCKTQATIVPCNQEIVCPNGPGTYFANGFDALTAVAAYDNQEAPRVPGALFYHANRVTPRWSRTKELVAEIGRHKFYE